MAMLVVVGGLVLFSYTWQPTGEQVPAEAAGSAVSPDVEGHWSVREVTLLSRLGVVEAGADGLYRPGDAITRAEMVRMLVRAFDIAEVRPIEAEHDLVYPPPDFTDVPEDHWIIPYLNQAQQMELVAGYQDETFRPDAGITREEMAGLFHRIFAQPEPPEDAERRFADASDIQDWAVPAVLWNAEMGLFRGFPDGTFRPALLTTRAEAAVLVKRALQLRGALFTLQGEVTEVDGRTGVVRLALPDDQMLTLDLADVHLSRGDDEISPDALRRGDYLQVVCDAHGTPIAAAAPYASFTAVLESQDLLRRTLEIRPLYPAEEPDTPAVDSWAGTAFWSAAGEAQRLNSAETASIYWDGRTEFYRQGISAHAYQLRPGDRLNITLWPDAPVMRRVDAVSYDSWGRVEDVTTTGLADELMVTWRDGAGELVTGEVTPNTRIEASGRPAAPGILLPDLFVGAVRVRDSSQLSYIEVYGAEGVSAAADASLVAGSAGDDREEHGTGGAEAVIPTPVNLAHPAEDVDGLPETEGQVLVRESPGTPTNSGVIGATDLRDVLQVDGSEVLVAVVDTGVDPLTPGVFIASGGTARLADWRDFTGQPDIAERAAGGPGIRLAEGDVVTREEVRIEGGSFYYDGREFSIEGPIPPEGVLRCGWVRSDFFRPERTARDRILVAAASMQEGTGYDAVYVDVNGDGVLRESDLFRSVRDGGQPGTLTFGEGDGPPAHFVIADIEPEGRLVNLGFDGSGHGTKVAGVVAAAERDNVSGGVAPGVDLMALKALSSDGSGSWGDVMQAVQYAAEQGADVINVSVTGLRDLSSGSTRESRVLAEIAKEHDVLIITAVGNTGPGLATAYTPGDPRWTLSVGAAALPELVLRDYGYSLAAPSVWPYSSMGPRADGGLAPSLLAPGSTYVPLPAWLAPGERKFFEGTSCAAAHVTGAAALLIQGARDREMAVTMQGIKRALEEGAASLSGYLPVEQGFGMVRVVESWLALQRDPRGISQVELALDSGVMVERPLSEMDPLGIYLRHHVPGGLTVSLRNRDDEPSRVSVTPEMPWASLPIRDLRIPGNAEMDLPLSYELPPGPHVLSGFLRVDDERTPGTDDRLLHTILRPQNLGVDQPALHERGELNAGAWRRYFVRVPEGVSHLRAEVGVPDPDAGRVYMQIVDPHGDQVHFSPHVGAGSRGRWGEEQLHTSRVIERPQPGVWEIIVSSASSLSFYGLDSSEYDFSVDVLPRGSLMLVPEQTEWRFGRPETVPDSLQVRVEIDADVGGDMLEALRPLGVGLVSEPEEVQVLRRQRIEGTADEFRYLHFEVPEDTAVLHLWSGNPNPEEVEVQMYLYRDDGYGRMEEVIAEPGEDDQFMRVRNPVPGEYMLAARPDSGEPCNYEVMAEAWPARWDVQVNGPVIGRGGSYELAVRMEVPPRPGSYWALVGLQTADGLPVARTWMQVEVGASSVLISSSPVASGVAPLRIAVRDPETLQAVGGVVSLDDQLYTLNEDGVITIPSVDPQDRLNHFEVRYNSGEDEWSPPVRLAVSGLSDEQLMSWRRGLMRLLAGGELDNPLIRRRWDTFFHPGEGR